MTGSIRLLSHVDDLRRCELIQREVWGLEDREILSGTHMRALVHAGGMVAGAFVDGNLVGFVFGFLARHGDRADGVGFHSHLLAVLQEYRGRRLGIRLKWFQRGWCLQNGVPWMTWTFDPLQRGNARLNLEHLGAVSDRYLTNFYGRIGGTLSGSVSTDRLLVSWDLDGEQVAALADGGVRPTLSAEGLPSVLARREGNEPGEPDLEAVAPRLLVALPDDFTAMIEQDPDRAERWRARVRATLTHYFAREYRVGRVVDRGYLLERRLEVGVEGNNLQNDKTK